MKKITALILAGTIVAGCAKDPSLIEASYVSPMIYEGYSCDQLAAEAQRLSAAASDTMGTQEKKATRDAVAMGVALVVFWPALFFIRGGGATEAEVSRLKGEMDAIEQASIRQGCGIAFAEVAE